MGGKRGLSGSGSGAGAGVVMRADWFIYAISAAPCLAPATPPVMAAALQPSHLVLRTKHCRDERSDDKNTEHCERFRGPFYDGAAAASSVPQAYAPGHGRVGCSAEEAMFSPAHFFAAALYVDT